jgi:hypothetical protein
MNETHMPVYTRRVTFEQMNEESKKATAEGMRQLAEVIAKQKKYPEKCSEFDPKSDSNFESESDSDSESTHEYYNKSKRRKRSRSPQSTQTIDKLENKIRFMGLDLMNAHVEIEENKEKVETLTAQLMPLKRVNDEIGYLKSSMNRALKGIEIMNKLQLEARHKLILEEANEHATMCNVACLKIDIEEVKNGMLRVLNAERKRLSHLDANFKLLIFKTYIKETTIYMASWSSVILAFIAILYGCIIYFIS